ncbi:MAG: impB/mucB/samB family protein [Micavibrio aeruginosavorus]|uniref:ImpB/mucB/samB family protein n=1 Tax=Micavibrio aeruginosavorus TaxID=349221 RepID=A0A7T5R433_9BACT|nr:MAG: impB/mucB/samB family protein [Micavibrio aeruginosavorus]
MKPGAALSWLFLDLNSYFASVEQQINPALRGKPVVVVPMMTDYTCAIAASYEAKAYGIKTGTGIAEAKKLCPRLHCVLARHDQYVRYHHRIVDEFVRHTPLNKVWSIDEMSSRLPTGKRTLQAATDLAHALREGIWENVGHYINGSIGIAPNSFLAKVATDMKKPNGLVILQHEDMHERLFTLDLIDLPGINTRMLERLRQAGITSVEKLWHISPKHARMIWGSVNGERFWYNLHGYDVPDQPTNPGMIGHSRILDPELRPVDKARQVARRLTLKAATRLRRMGFYATRCHLSVRLADGPRWSGEMQLHPAQDNFTFVHSLDAMWDIMRTEERPVKIKKISVTLHGLRKPEDITLDFFHTETIQGKRQQSLSLLMDDINEKYGAETLRLGISPRTQAGYLGTKIAFSRVPDLAEFAE